MIETCKCCGHPLPTAAVAEQLSPRRRRYFEIVHRAGQAGITGHDLKDLLYMHDADGGAADLRIIPVMRMQINPFLAPHGLKIICSHRGPLSRYRLVPL